MRSADIVALTARSGAFMKSFEPMKCLPACGKENSYPDSGFRPISGASRHPYRDDSVAVSRCAIQPA